MHTQRKPLVIAACLVVCILTGILAMSGCASNDMAWYQVVQLYANQDKLANALENSGFTYDERMSDGKAYDTWRNDDGLSIADSTASSVIINVSDSVTDLLDETYSKQDLEDGKRGDITVMYTTDSDIGSSSDEIKSYVDKVCDQCGLANTKAENTYSLAESSSTESSESGGEGYARAGRVTANGEDVFWLVNVMPAGTSTLVLLGASGTDLSDEYVMTED